MSFFPFLLESLFSLFLCFPIFYQVISQNSSLFLNLGQIQKFPPQELVQVLSGSMLLSWSWFYTFRLICASLLRLINKPGIHIFPFTHIPPPPSVGEKIIFKKGKEKDGIKGRRGEKENLILKEKKDIFPLYSTDILRGKISVRKKGMGKNIIFL